MFMLPAILIPIQIYKSYLCLGVTNIYFAYMILILIQNRNLILIRKRKYISHSSDSLPANLNPETEILIYKSLLCLGVTQKSKRWIGNMVASSQLSQPNTWSCTEPKDPNPETEILMMKIHKNQ